VSDVNEPISLEKSVDERSSSLRRPKLLVASMALDD
jgi:hypothetical protein